MTIHATDKIANAICRLDNDLKSCPPEKLASYRTQAPVTEPAALGSVNFEWRGSQYNLFCRNDLCTLSKFQEQSLLWDLAAAAITIGSLGIINVLAGCSDNPQEGADTVTEFPDSDSHTTNSNNTDIGQTSGQDTHINTSITIQQLSAGNNKTCALLESGAVMCWGDWYNESSDLTKPKSVDLAYTGDPIIQISTGGRFACALSSGSSVQCWGNNFQGQLGSGDDKQYKLPIFVKGLDAAQIKEITTGDMHACALTTQGKVQCWGDNFRGQLGIGKVDPTGIYLPQYVKDLGENTNNPVLHIAAGPMYTCAIVEIGHIMCWGGNDILLQGSALSESIPTPVPVNGISTTKKPIQLASGGALACALLEGGAVQCWGGVYNSSLGDGVSNSAYSAVYVKGIEPGNPAIQVVAGSNYSCALLKDLTIKCWGQPIWSEQPVTQMLPITINDLKGTQISAGQLHMCSLDQSGAVWCWGSNYNGELGNGTKSDHFSPEPTLVNFN